MGNRKESEIIERISEVTGKPKSTLYDWKKNEKNIKLYEALQEYIDLKDNEAKKHPDLNDPNYMVDEIMKDLKRLPVNQIKILYHSIKMKLAEIGL